MANWTDELKQQAIEMYTEGEPTPENSTELIKQIAEELDQSANGVRTNLEHIAKETGKPLTELPDSKVPSARLYDILITLEALYNIVERQDLLQRGAVKAPEYYQ